MADSIVANLKPPYYVVTFTTVLSKDAGDDYNTTADRMVELAKTMPGYLGVESARDENLGITLSYWQSEADIKHWKMEAEHKAARDQGRAKWYEAFDLKVAKVERGYSFNKV